MAPVNMTLRDAKEIANSLRELSAMYQEFGDVVTGISRGVKRLKPLIGEPRGEENTTESRLIAAGLALIAFPDPTITDLIGAAMVAAGMMKDRTRPLTALETCREFDETIRKTMNSARELGR